jgi:hypothetical protein
LLIRRRAPAADRWELRLLLYLTGYWPPSVPRVPTVCRARWLIARMADCRRPLAESWPAATNSRESPPMFSGTRSLVADELGYTEATVAALLGQRSGNVTRRYIHHLDSALVAAADRVSAHIQASMSDASGRDYSRAAVPTGDQRPLGGFLLANSGSGSA